jgi:hypothetical protein
MARIPVLQPPGRVVHAPGLDGACTILPSAVAV